MAADQDYEKVLVDAFAKMSELADQRDKIDIELARLKNFMYATRDMLPDDKRRTFDEAFELVKGLVESGSVGLTDAIKRVLKNSPNWFTAAQVRDCLVSQGFDFTAYLSNPLASVSTTLRRLKPQEVETSENKGVATYRWKHRFPREKLRPGRTTSSDKITLSSLLPAEWSKGTKG